MGMAASQARFLGLTARKTNTEYEGQQINQQRTTLSNQSANYYNQLLGMTVPVPPSIADYTKTVYTFSDGALSNSISSMIAQQNGNYLISYTSSWTNDFAVVSASPAIYTRVKTNDEENPYDYYVGSVKLRQLTSRTDEQIEALTEEQLKDLRGDDEYLNSLDDTQLKNLLKEENKYISQLNDKYGQGEWMVRYVKNTSTNTWTPYFVNKDVLEAETTNYNDNGVSQSSIPTYSIGSAQETEEVKGVTAKLEQDASGRIISITLNPDDPATKVTYAVKTNSVTDQDAYDDAMNQYEYDKYQYDQSIQEINAKIEIVQAEDKNLELRLKQLDTEQDAIQTEMDAVQKVIEKNTESTFKTFG